MTTNGITLKNTVTGEVLELDKITTEAYILESVFWSEIQGTHHSYKYIGQTGESVTNTTLETRDFDIVGWIVAGVNKETGEAEYWAKDENGQEYKTVDLQLANQNKAATDDLLPTVYGGFGTTVSAFGFDASIQELRISVCQLRPAYELVPPCINDW